MNNMGQVQEPHYESGASLARTITEQLGTAITSGDFSGDQRKALGNILSMVISKDDQDLQRAAQGLGDELMVILEVLLRK